MERLLLAVATALLLGAVGFTVYLVGAGRDLPHRFNFWMLLGAFGGLSGFLWLRGQEIGRCPLTSLFEVMIFLGWATLLIYLIVGSSYRVSLMGAFAGPMALLLLIVGLLAGERAANPSTAVLNPWIELHAALSVIAYGAFGLACVGGVMYFLQDRMLKTRRILPIFYRLPPVNHLAKVNDRLLLIGVALLACGIGAGFAVGYLPDKGKMLGAILVWLVYFAILLARWLHGLNPTRMALVSIYSFPVSMAIFLWIASNSVE